LSKNSYLSQRRITSILSIHQSTVKHILREDLSLWKVKFKWIPHLLDDHQKSERVQLSTELLEFLESKLKRQLVNVYTGDERWICYDNPRSSMWAGVDFARPTRARPFIEAKK
jgi:hypothetical protein